MDMRLDWFGNSVAEADHPGVQPPLRTLVALDPAMAAMVERAERIAWSEASVLIEGESGTGKEVLAHHVHHHSRRSAGPFVAVNCAAIPEYLLESELFGHERGAFSGAIGRKLGKFELAQRGTILLDEIGEMDVRLQAKLLRALQEREVDRVGGRSPIKIDVRVIATTNRNLRLEVSRKSFREDLFFRLNVAALRIPPLRERPADIGALAEYFSRKYAAENALPSMTFTDAARSRLLSYSWPGNVRELENIVHRAVILAAGARIDDSALDLPPAAIPMRWGEAEETRGTCFVAQSLDQMERELILRTLSHTGGNRTRAAVILGISIRALRNKLRNYEVSGPPAATLSGQL